MKKNKNLFFAQDATQILRICVLREELLKQDHQENYLVIGGISRSPDPEFYKVLGSISEAYKWDGKAILQEESIPDDIFSYIQNRSELVKKVKNQIYNATGKQSFDCIYICRNWQWAPDAILQGYGDNAEIIFFGDGFGCLDVRKQKWYKQGSRFNAILPIIHSIDRGYESVEEKNLQLNISSKENCMKALNKINNRQNIWKLENISQGGLLVNTSSLTESGNLRNPETEINLYVEQVLKISGKVRKKGIIIKPHPREAFNQGRGLKQKLLSLGEKAICLNEEQELLKYVPIELIYQAIKPKLTFSPALSYSSLNLKYLFNAITIPPNFWDLEFSQPEAWENFIRSYLDLSTALVRLPKWSKIDFLNQRLNHPCLIPCSTKNDAPKIISKLKHLKKHYSKSTILKKIIKGVILDKKKKVRPLKIGIQRATWQKEGQPSEFNVHVNDPYRQSEVFDLDSEIIFKSAGFCRDLWDNKRILDIGAGSKSRAFYFRNAKVTVLEPLANRFMREISWCNLRNAEKVLSVAAENKIFSLKNKFDFILSINVLDHCFNFERNVQNIEFYLKKGGYAYLSFDQHSFTDEQHPLILNEEICTKTFKKNGLKIFKKSKGIPGLLMSYGHGPYCLNYTLCK